MTTERDKPAEPPQRQPTAYMIENDGAVGFARTMSEMQRAAAARAGSRITPLGPLYAASPPPAAAPAYGSIAERAAAGKDAGMWAEQPQPVAWRCQFSDRRWHYIHGDRDPSEALSPGMAATLQRLYTDPPPPAAAPIEVTDAMVEAARRQHRAVTGRDISVDEAWAVLDAALALLEKADRLLNIAGDATQTFPMVSIGHWQDEYRALLGKDGEAKQ